MSFDGTGSSDGDGTIVSYAWDFGDTGTGTGASPTHTYATAGLYTVSLTVTDDGGLTDTATTTADIQVPPNQPPVADAGMNQNAETGTLVTLDGSNSFDPDGDLISYDWRVEAKPAGSLLADAGIAGRTTPSPSLTPDVDGLYVFQLIVNDGLLDSLPALVEVQASPPNVPPNADAGKDQNALVANAVFLDGSGSNDPDGQPAALTYQWSFKLVPASSQLVDGDIVSSDQSQASFVPDVAGTFVLRLEVFDGQDATADEVNIIVVSDANVAPNARAGDDAHVNVGEEVVLDGTSSQDPANGPEALSFGWRLVSVAPGSLLTNGDIVDAQTPTPRLIPDTIGHYVLELQVFDGAASDFDNVMITVEAASLPCDVDGNGQVDLSDITVIFDTIGSTAAPGDPRDLDGDGLITILDARGCVLRCANRRCAPSREAYTSSFRRRRHITRSHR